MKTSFLNLLSLSVIFNYDCSSSFKTELMNEKSRALKITHSKQYHSVRLKRQAIDQLPDSATTETSNSDESSTSDESSDTAESSSASENTGNSFLALAPYISGLEPLLPVLLPVLPVLKPFIPGILSIVADLAPYGPSLGPFAAAIAPGTSALEPLVPALATGANALAPILNPLLNATAPITNLGLKVGLPLFQAFAAPVLSALAPVVEKLSPTLEGLKPAVSLISPGAQIGANLINGIVSPLTNSLGNILNGNSNQKSPINNGGLLGILG